MTARFVDVYREYVDAAVKPARHDLKRILKQWKARSYWAEHSSHMGSAIPEPIFRTKVRIKRAESVLDKYARLVEQFPDGPTADNIHLIRDLLGGRIIVYFPYHLKMVDSELRSGKDFELSSESRPRCYLPLDTANRIGLDTSKFDMRGPKLSGYASIHYMVRRTNANDKPNPWFELQTRTMLEDVWGELEHQLGYKPQQQTAFSVSRQFRVMSHHLAAIDDHFDFVYDHLTYLQSQSNPSSDQPLNAENLPRVLGGIDISCSQGEIDRLLEILGSYGVRTVNDFQVRTKTEIVEALSSEFLAMKNERIDAFTLVATIVHLSRNSSSQQAIEQLRGIMTLNRLSHELRKDD